MAIKRLTPGSEARAEWLNKPGIQRLPMKFVFTVKPNDRAVQEEPGTWYKRKARLVICGNMAVDSGAQVYTETAPAEAVRAGLAVASRNKWCVAILDVVAAFIKTILGRKSKDPIVVAQPPRLLEALGLTVRMELWGLIRALYGLREAPTLWGSFRDDTLRTLRAPSGCFWDQGRSATAWWSIRTDRGEVKAIVIVYVDGLYDLWAKGRGPRAVSSYSRSLGDVRVVHSGAAKFDKVPWDGIKARGGDQ